MRENEPREFDIELTENVPAPIPGSDRTAAVFSDREKVDNLKKVHSNFTYTSLDRDNIVGAIRVRSRRPGDRLRVRGVSRTVKSLLQEAGVPASERDSLPVFCDGRGPVWIPGVDVGQNGCLFLCAWRE